MANRKTSSRADDFAIVFNIWLLTLLYVDIGGAMISYQFSDALQCCNKGLILTIIEQYFTKVVIYFV